MMIKWYIVPYKTKPEQGLFGAKVKRYCAMDDFTRQIYAIGGQWAETEMLGNRAIVKVRTTAEIHIELSKVFKLLPNKKLSESINASEKTDLDNELLDAGYSSFEISTKFNNNKKTMVDFYKTATTHRKLSRFVDEEKTTIVVDGGFVACEKNGITRIDNEVK